MPDFLTNALQPLPSGGFSVLVRLVLAMLAGGVVTLIYRFTRAADETAPSFTVTLVLLAILIAMVTQVIGDNVARAFSLVGALSIVRFRTVVRDTQDTAYVIFAVGVGMAAGAGQYWVALAGIAVGAAAAAAMKISPQADVPSAPLFELQIRLGIGHDPRLLIGPALNEHARWHQLVSLTSARQGLAVEASYRVTLREEESADALVRTLNGIDG